MRGIIINAIEAAQPNGAVGKYFAQKVKMEADLRQQFAILKILLNTNADLAREEGINLLRRLNGLYTTRYAVSQIAGLYDDFYYVVSGMGWLQTSPPQLLGGGKEVADELAIVVFNILLRIRQRGANLPYSLLSKWLYFCFPETFAIYDSQAEKSLKIWSDFAFSSMSLKNPERRQFNLRLFHWSDPKWYYGLLRFYQLFWEAAVEAELSQSLDNASENIQTLLRSQDNCADARMTVLDIVDKFLWVSNGNKIVLGVI